MARVIAKDSFEISDLEFNDLLSLNAELFENINLTYRGVFFRDIAQFTFGDFPGGIAFGGTDLGIDPVTGTVTGIIIEDAITADEALFISGFSIAASAINAAAQTESTQDDAAVWARIFRGADNVFLSAFEDVARFGFGDDFIRGFGGDDSLWGEAGNDTMLGGGGDDYLSGGGGKDFIRGGGGNDTLEGGANDDNLAGQAGDDTLNGQQGNDFLNGNGGNDTIVGAGGQDTLVGGGGDDVLSGGGGDDRLFGGVGMDRLDGGGGDDVLTGGPGADVFIFRKRYGDDEITDFELGRDRLALDPALWGGSLTLEQVVDRFGVATSDGFALDFGADIVRFTGLDVEGLTSRDLAESLVLFGDL
jgi:Ca2+-binding RTX toxin-like protein